MKKSSLWVLFGALFLLPFQVQTAECLLKQLPLDALKGENYHISAEGRYRLEYRKDFGFKEASDAFHLTRFRLNGDFTPFKHVRLFVQAQDSRVYESDFRGEALNGYENDFDLRQGYVELDHLFDLPLALMVGRQELAYGEERLIGGFNWSNVAQTFDALRVRYDTEAYRIDLFSSQKVIVRDDHFDERDHQDYFHGIYGTWKKIKNHIVDAYVLFRDTKKPRQISRAEAAAKMDEVTIGGRIKGSNLKNWDYSVELAGQAGNYGNDEIKALAVIGQVGYTVPNCPINSHIFVEYAYASGDKDPGDGDRGTFDNLFPTNHGFYGWADQVSLQNINDIEFGFDIKPVDKLKVVFSLHLFYLAEKEDALYNAGRGVSRFDPTGKASSTVGQEIDVKAKYNLCPNSSVEIGYAHFFTGGFIADTGSSKDLDFFYTMLSFKY